MTQRRKSENRDNPIESQNLFSPPQDTQDLKGRSIHGVFSTSIAGALNSIMRIGFMIILCRMLTPEDFGLIAMVTSLTAFTEKLKDLGLSSATIQYQTIDHGQVSTLFWINCGVGLAITLSIMVLSKPIAWFYNEPRLFQISIVLSISFIFKGMTIQHEALLRRQMRFGSLALIQVISAASSFGLAIYLSWIGSTYWTLVWKELFGVACIALLTWVACRWIPGLPVWNSEVSGMLRFGRDITVFDMVNFISLSLDKILIGKYFGAASLGFYRQAYQLISVPVNQLKFPTDIVSLPLLSAVQNDAGRFSGYYKKIVSTLAFFTMPLTVYATIYSEQIIRFVLGDKWIACSDIFRVLAIGAFIQPVASTCGFVMVACDKTRRYLWWGVGNAFFIIVAFCAGIWWGALGVAIGYAAVSYLVLLPSGWYGFKGTPVTMRLFFESIWGPAASSILMGIILIEIINKIFVTNDILHLGMSVVISAVIYICIFTILPGGRSRIYEFCSYAVYPFNHLSRRRTRVVAGE